MTHPRIAAVCLALVAGTAPAAPLSVDIGRTRIEARVRSFVDLRDQGVVKQTLDYSCGAASFATLLTYGLNDPITELEVLEQVLARLKAEDEAQLKKKGLSLL